MMSNYYPRLLRLLSIFNLNFYGFQVFLMVSSLLSGILFI